MKPPILLAFSGGRDSTFLLEVLEKLSHQHCHAVFFHTPFVSPHTLTAVRTYLERRGTTHTILEVDPLRIAAIAENTPQRCYHCKRLLFETLLRRFDDKHPRGRVMEGTTLSEVLQEHRPGLRAIEELGIESPLRLSGMLEEDLETLRVEYGFNEGVDDIGCLATRIPHGVPISRELLNRIDQAEAFLREKGFRQVRARYLRQALKIEIHREELERLVRQPLRNAYLNYLKKLGFSEIFLDLNGYRTGSIETMTIGGQQS